MTNASADPRRTKRIRLACLATASILLPSALPGWSAERDTPAGRWLTQDREAVIAIEPCGNALCGRIVGVTLDHPDDPFPVDNEGHSQCGLTIIRGGVPDGEQANGEQANGEQANGEQVWAIRITDPRDGKVYRARMWLDEQRRLHVRGYIGVPLLGRTQVWTPFRAAIGENCRLPAR